MSPSTRHRILPSNFAVLFSLAAALGSAHGSNPEAAPPIEALGFLSGCWASDGAGERVEEMWTGAAGGAMLGLSRTVRGDRLQLFEFLRIAPHEGRLAYLAQPNGQPAVAFVLSTVAANRAVFENPEHDFPKRIEYRRSGDSLRAELSGPATGSEAPFSIDYTRTDCPGR